MSTFKIGEKKERLRSVKIGKLTTVMEVAAEIGRVYRDARCERIDSSLANRLANILSVCGSAWRRQNLSGVLPRSSEPCRRVWARLQLTDSSRATASRMNWTCLKSDRRH